MIRRRLLAGLAAVVASAPFAASHALAAAPLSPARRSTLENFLRALHAERFDRAFALLSSKEQKYFGSATNYASIFAADRLKVDAYTILDAKPAPGGVLAVVKENVEFFDHAHQAALTATAKVAYGLLDENGAVRVKDPYHPWRALAPSDSAVTSGGVRATIRKISFFTGYVEFVVTFANVGDGNVTLLPYGRSVVRDDAGAVYHPIESTVDQLSDRQLRLGLILPAAGQYTGHLSFFTPNRFAPKSLTATFAPALRDGGDAPFELALPTVTLPAP